MVYPLAIKRGSLENPSLSSEIAQGPLAMFDDRGYSSRLVWWGSSSCPTDRSSFFMGELQASVLLLEQVLRTVAEAFSTDEKLASYHHLMRFNGCFFLNSKSSSNDDDEWWWIIGYHDHCQNCINIIAVLFFYQVNIHVSRTFLASTSILVYGSVSVPSLKISTDNMMYCIISVNIIYVFDQYWWYNRLTPL